MTKLIDNLRTKPHQRSEEGFTLIELMIVVVIIGILAAIAIPVFANQQIAAEKAAAISDVKSVHLAAFEFKAKHDGKLPRTCEEWQTVYSPSRISSTTVTLRVRVSPDGDHLFIEGHGNSVNGMANATPEEKANRSSFVAVYNSEKGEGVTNRAAYSDKYGMSYTTQAPDSGFTDAGFNLPRLNACTSW